MKIQREIEGPRKVNTHAITGKKQKNKAKEIDRAHRSHSKRETKQNKINKKNQG